MRDLQRLRAETLYMDMGEERQRVDVTRTESAFIDHGERSGLECRRAAFGASPLQITIKRGND